MCLVPLIRKNRNDSSEDEIKVKTFERQKQCLIKVADMNELRTRLKLVRTQIEEVKQCPQPAAYIKQKEDILQ